MAIVLGLHGWDGTHDAAAALVIDGEVIAFVEEERLTRRKHALSQRPRLATRAVLQAAGIHIEDVDVVAFGWDLPNYVPAHRGTFRFESDAELLRATLDLQAQRWPRVAWIRHHEAHAAAGFFSSGLDEAAVLVVDGQGEDRSISLYRADAKGLRLLEDWPPSCSLGFLYEAATLHCGFDFLQAGKTMGLAAFAAPPDDPLPIHWRDGELISPLRDDIEEEDVIVAWRELLRARFGDEASPVRVMDPLTSALRWRDSGVDQHKPSVAAAAQDAVERVLLGLVERAQQRTGSGDVVLVGGVALNCVANGQLAPHCRVLHVPPFSHDAGAALGAALRVAHDMGDRIAAVARADLGVEYSQQLIETAVEHSLMPYRCVDDPAVEAARRISEGQVIGWLQGRSEVGPRALGQRSILALPSAAENHVRVNRIKGREHWRPLAPSVLLPETSWMFGREVESPYMLRALPLTAQARERVPAIAHVDGSTRPQTVTDDGSPFARLLGELSRRVGTGVVLNTSFNAPAEPIVCSPRDAIRTYSTMGLDALLMGHVLLAKRS